MENSFEIIWGLYKRFKISPFDSTGKWIVLEDFEYHLQFKWSGNTIIIPAWFIFNWASIPRIFWVFFTPMDTDTIIASAVHDFLYEKKLFTRKKSDEIYYEVMTVCNTPSLKKVLQFLWLRLWWGYVWNYK